MARKNETMQRNYVHEVLSPEANDIVILADIDEIVDHTLAQELIDLARKHGVVSVELHHTMFYLNLFSQNWHELWDGAPENYAYRLFVMTGEHFNTMKYTSNSLRRDGEWGYINGKYIWKKAFTGFTIRGWETVIWR